MVALSELHETAMIAANDKKRSFLISVVKVEF